MPGTGYDQLNSSLAPSKSVFDSQQLSRPSVYRYCGRASLCIGIICLVAEMSVFIGKRGLTTYGVGIWTGVPFIVFGAVTLAVPRTRTVCSVTTGLVMGLACMAVAALGAAACAIHISELADVLARRTTPRPNFELSCAGCGHFIILKEIAQIGLLLLELLVSAALACIAYADCLCCQATETEVILAGTTPPPKTAATPPLPPPPPPPPPTLSSAAVVSLVAESSIQKPIIAADSATSASASRRQVQQQQHQQQQQQHQQQQRSPLNHQQVQHQLSFAGSSGGYGVGSSAGGIGGGSVGVPMPMLYDL